VQLPRNSPGCIPFGLSAVRNVGEAIVAQVIAERDARGPFTDFHDFCDRVPEPVLNKRTIESLIKAGAFDSLGHRRKGLLMVFEQIIDQTVARRRKEAEGQFDLFASLAEPSAAAVQRIAIPDVEFDKKERLAFEKEMLGLYVSDHPLLGAEAALRRRCECTVAEALERADGDLVTVGGVLTGVTRKYTKKGDLMGVFVLEDLQASIEAMVFPKVMAEHGYKLADDAVVVVKGRIDARDDTPKLIVSDVQVFDGIVDGAPPLRVRLPAAVSEATVERLKELLEAHPGESQVFVHLHEGRVLRLPDRFCADASNGLVAELREHFGYDAVLV
jgi:DNA polymerase-3 subunit alpha